MACSSSDLLHHLQTVVLLETSLLRTKDDDDDDYETTRAFCVLHDLGGLGIASPVSSQVKFAFCGSSCH